MSAAPYTRAVSVRRPPTTAGASRPVRTEERGGVLHILGTDGRSLGPVSSARVANTYAHALRRHGVKSA